MTQPSLFAQYLDPIKLKEGKEKCPCCGKRMAAYAKTLDVRLAGILKEIESYLDERKQKTFTLNEVFNLDHHKINDSQKLHYYKIIERIPKTELWKITQRGRDYLANKIPMPRHVWVFNNEVILEDDDLRFIGQLDPRWQTTKFDFCADYILQPYQTVINQ